MNNILFKTEEENEFIPLFSFNEQDMENEPALEMEEMIPILPLRNTVLFPGVVIPITVGRDKSIQAVKAAFGKDKLIGVVSQMDGNIEDPTAADLCKIGTVAKVIKMIKMQDGGTTIIIQGKKRFELIEMVEVDPFFKAKVAIIEEETILKEDQNFQALLATIKDLATQIIQMSPNFPSEAAMILKNIESPLFLINFVSSNLNVTINEKQALLELNGITARAEKLIHFLQQELQFVELKNKVANKTRTELDKQQRDYFLQQQLKSIKDELGGDPNEREIVEMKKKAESKKWPDAAKKLFQTGLEKLERMHPSTPDYSVVYNHLDLLLDLPWLEYTDDNYDLKHAKKVLDNDHYGMSKIKNRIIEYLAVLKLKGDMKSPILCFLGPPGIGKTSLGRSIAHAIGRKYTRVSLGGLHDESEIRGHRKTYIGAMPGRIIQSIRKSGTSNPVFVLDEIDKISSGSQGDPSSALLELLDPEQNNSFHDNFLEIGYDLSKVMFIATANNLSSMHPALLDRMELINVSGYTSEEKTSIASKFLIKKQLSEHGMKSNDFKINNQTLKDIISGYTRESGVRNLEKQIAKLIRNRAKNIVSQSKLNDSKDIDYLKNVLGPKKFFRDKYENNSVAGVVTGLAWTSVGGEILFIESSISDGKGNLSITGNLGKIMKESAIIALEYIKSNHKLLGINNELDYTKYNIHIHVPEGAVPKDGPSAGITMMTALASAFTGKRVKPFLAMTGEITLRGRVLPIGGLKEKSIAAHRSGLKTILIPKDNEKDYHDFLEKYSKTVNVDGISFHPIETIDEALKYSIEE